MSSNALRVWVLALGVLLVGASCSSSESSEEPAAFPISVEADSGEEFTFEPETEIDVYPKCFYLLDSDRNQVALLRVGATELEPIGSFCTLEGLLEPPVLYVPEGLDPGFYQVCVEVTRTSGTNCMGIQVR